MPARRDVKDMENRRGDGDGRISAVEAVTAGSGGRCEEALKDQTRGRVVSPMCSRGERMAAGRVREGRR
jgi:hypothetical protein